VQTHRPSLVFISETRQSADRVKNLRYRLGMNNCYHVPGVGTGSGGGIALYWTEEVSVNVLSCSHRYIDAHIEGGPYDTRWRGTFVYGEPKPDDRHLMWTLLRRIMPRSSDPWLMIGDFNEAMWQGEHFSRSRRSERLMNNFREVLSHCDMHDLCFLGTPWTYDNHRKGDSNVRVGLDRDVASPAWNTLFPGMRVKEICP
jgi:hypothetical protein